MNFQIERTVKHMKNVMGVIYTGEKDNFLRELTIKRAVAALPLAGRYRVIDFYVSSMVNSGIRNVGVIVQKNYHSLMDQLGSGKEWDLHGKNDGLYILPPFLNQDTTGGYKGSLDALHSNKGYLRRSRQEYVLLTNSLMVFNADFRELFQAFLESGSEIMTLYTKDESMIRSEYGTYLDIDENNHIVDMEIDPTTPNYSNTSLEVYIMRKDWLLNLIDRGISKGSHSFTKDIIQPLVQDSSVQVSAYEYKEKAFRLDSIQSYFQCNLAMLDTETRQQIFTKNEPVYTKVRDELPARYMESAIMRNSIVADGCIVNGTVEHSVLFRGVKIGNGAVVKNCVIMQDSIIEEGAYLENCILDKQAVIRKNRRLIGPSTYPIVISKEMII